MRFHVPEFETPVPAQAETTPAPVLTAVESAVAKDDFTAFRETRRAERSGTPAPAPVADPAPVIPPAAPAAPTAEARAVSKRQQQINDYERRIAEQDQRIRALESGSATPAPPPAAPRTEPVAGETFPAYAQYLEKNPDASLEDYIDARQDFRESVKAKAAHAQRADADRSRGQQEAMEQAHARTLAARQADPAIDAKFAAWEQPGAELPEVLFIKTRDQAIAAQQIPMAENDFADRVARSKFSAHLIAHVADHPEILAEVRALESRSDVIAFVGALETLFKKTDTPPTPVPPKTISSAPAPGTALGSRPASASNPVTAAVIAGDVTAYRAARLAERSAGRKP